MNKKLFCLQIRLFLPVLVALTLAPLAEARDLRIVIPRRGLETPAQRLNRQGVREIQKHHYKKAEKLFYKAYLYDPADPFTLNNLGYVSEIEGQLSQAEQFYHLADEQSNDAMIAFSNENKLKGQPMLDAVRAIHDEPMKVNRLNIKAIELLSHNHPFEAVKVLQATMTIEPHNAFTLNNMGVALEATGDFAAALRSFERAADSQAAANVLVSMNHRWIGKPVHELAARNAQKLQKRIKSMSPNSIKAIKLSIHGVSAINQNRWAEAREDFLRAYSLSPTDAFSLNNRGYVAEREGELESAQFYFSMVRKADDANEKVGWTSSKQTPVKPIIKFVASANNYNVNEALAEYSKQRRETGGPIVLIPRKNGFLQQHPAPVVSKPQDHNQSSILHLSSKVQ
jgi:Flp pilus assembly protein TadD